MNLMNPRRSALRDDQRQRIKHLFPGRVGTAGVAAKNNLLFVEPVLTSGDT